MKANKTIRWKVVDKNGNSWISESVRRYRETAPDIAPWFKELHYKINKITKAPKKSWGCFCYKSKHQATKICNIGNSECRILKVKTYGKAKNPGLYFAENYPGTICYPAVMPLE